MRLRLITFENSVMKNFLRKLASPLLNPLENATGDYHYSPSHRTILWVMGALFLGVSGVTLYFSLQIQQTAGLLPVALFGGIALVCFIVAGLGNDKAVAKIWRNRDGR